VSGGTIGVDDAAQDVKLNGDITAQTTAAANTINLAAHSLTLQDASQILSVNGILSAGAASASIATAGQMQPAISGGELVVRVNGPSDGLSLEPVIQNNASASALTKSGAGTLTLSGTNTYTGTTRINAGTLALSGGSAIADAGRLSWRMRRAPRSCSTPTRPSAASAGAASRGARWTSRVTP